jgi:hypothetical protein
MGPIRVANVENRPIPHFALSPVQCSQPKEDTVERRTFAGKGPVSSVAPWKSIFTEPGSQMARFTILDCHFCVTATIILCIMLLSIRL